MHVKYTDLIEGVIYTVTIYSYIYLIIIIGMMLCLIRHRIDLLLIASVCYIVYTIYCIPGIGISGSYTPKLSPELYYLVYMQCITIMLFVFGTRRREKEDKKTDTKRYEKKPKKASTVLKASFYVYTLIIVVFAAANILRIGFSGFAAGKENVWEETNILYIISLYGAYPSFAFGLHNHIKTIWIPSLLVELTIFFAGSRAFATTLVIIFLCERGSYLWKERRKTYKLLIVGAIAVVFLLMYRMVDQQIMSGDIAGVLTTIKQPDAWLEALEFNEPRVIIANYQYVVANKFRLPFGDTLYRLLDFIPGLTFLLPIKLKYPEYFSSWLKDEVQAVRGVGGSIWGESYAMFGVLGVFVFTVIWLMILHYCNKHLDYHSSSSYFIVPLAAYYAWYINRLEFNLLGQAFKVFVLCFIIWAIIYLVMGGTVEVLKYRIRHSSKIY